MQNIIIKNPVSRMALPNRVFPDPISRRDGALSEIMKRKDKNLLWINHRRIGIHLRWLDDHMIGNGHLLQGFTRQPGLPTAFGHNIERIAWISGHAQRER